MENKTKFFESSPGNNSSSRLVAFIVIIVALIFVQEIIYLSKDNLKDILAIAGVFFVTIAGPAMALLFGQKYHERKNNDKQG